jgi:ribose transport system substrate-binding protein
MATRKFTVTLIILVIITVSLVCISSFLLVNVSTRASSVARKRTGEGYKWHIMMIGQRIDSPFWQDVFSGAKAAGAKQHAIVELVGPASDADTKSPDEYINYAVAARVDGILAYVTDTDASLAALQNAERKGIPVITLDNDSVNSARRSFVGVSSYELGKILGGLVHDAAGSFGNALVILDRSSVKSSETIMLSAMQEAMQPYPYLHLSSTGVKGAKESGYEGFIRERILNDPGLSVIVCLNVEDTIRVAQVLIDLNKTDKISIVAFRESKEIFDYVRKGIVYAVVVIDAKQMGQKAAEGMIEFLETKHANDYVITDMHVVTRNSPELEQK